MNPNNRLPSPPPKKKKNRYISSPLRTVFDITAIYTIHYFEYDCGYVFQGERHDFWEVMFVDYGAVEVTAGDRVLALKKGDVIFHQPNEFHALRATGKNPPNLIVFSFDCDSPYMDAFREKVMRPNEAETLLFGKLVDEARNSFQMPLRNPLSYRYDAPFGSEQVLRSTMENLLISLYRRSAEAAATLAVSEVSAPGSHTRQLEQVVSYLQDRIYESLTVERICRDNMISRSLLQRIFHEYKGCGVIEYFNRMKIDTAKRLIRENRYTFSQIATMLNYSSYQYFSLQFKKYARMSPSEYHSSSQHFH